jgi:probable rRNA maturation factor
LKIKIFYDNINYRIKKSRKALKLIEKVIRNEQKVPGDLYFIITTDKELIKINREFLKRNNLTDVITFDYSKNKTVKGEIYISIETVKRNSYNYKVSLRDELMRVMIHGTLHMCGYNDKSKKEKRIMEEREDYWLKEIN